MEHAVTADAGPRRPRGRPRKWADDAERGRAYRARKARQLAEPLALRRKVQELHTALRDAKRNLGRARRTAERARRRAAELEVRSASLQARTQSRIHQLEREVAELARRAEAAEGRSERLAAQLQRDRAAPPVPQPPLALFGNALPASTPQLNRAQRRARDRRR